MTDFVSVVFGDNPPLVIWMLVGLAAMGVWMRAVVNGEGDRTRKLLHERFEAQNGVLLRLDERSSKGGAA